MIAKRFAMAAITIMIIRATRVQQPMRPLSIRPESRTLFHTHTRIGTVGRTDALVGPSKTRKSG